MTANDNTSALERLRSISDQDQRTVRSRMEGKVIVVASAAAGEDWRQEIVDQLRAEALVIGLRIIGAHDHQLTQANKRLHHVIADLGMVAKECSALAVVNGNGLGWRLWEAADAAIFAVITDPCHRLIVFGSGRVVPYDAVNGGGSLLETLAHSFGNRETTVDAPVSIATEPSIGDNTVSPYPTEPPKSEAVS